MERDDPLPPGRMREEIRGQGQKVNSSGFFCSFTTETGKSTGMDDKREKSSLVGVSGCSFIRKRSQRTIRTE